MKQHIIPGGVMVYEGDCLESLRAMESERFDCCVTSPPYFGLRDYGHDGQIGLEETPDAYVKRLVEVFREVRRTLRKDGTLWLNLGDSYAGSGMGDQGKHGEMSRRSVAYARNRVKGNQKKDVDCKPKDLIGIPWMVAFALRADGWYLRSDIIWSKPNPMPESVTDRPTKSHEYIFLLSKSGRYFYDAQAIAEPVSESNGGVRPQTARALELAEQHGLTQAHLDAVRAVGMSDAGKAAVTQSGSGKNTDSVLQLAQEAKAVLGGYFREFVGSKRAEGDVYTAKAFEGRPQSAPRGPKKNFGESAGGTRNARTVWPIATKPYADAHFATFPPELPRRCILAGCPLGGEVLDPFGGSGTTGQVARALGRRTALCELNPEYVALMRKRLCADQGVMDFAAA